MPRSFGSVSLRLAADLLAAAATGELGEVSENATKALLGGGGEGAGKGEGLVITGEGLAVEREDLASERGGLAAEGEGLAAIGEGATNGLTSEGEEVCNLTVVKPCR